MSINKKRFSQTKRVEKDFYNKKRFKKIHTIRRDSRR